MIDRFEEEFESFPPLTPEQEFELLISLAGKTWLKDDPLFILGLTSGFVEQEYLNASLKEQLSVYAGHQEHKEFICPTCGQDWAQS